MKAPDLAPILLFLFCNFICLLLYLAPYKLVAPTIPILDINFATSSAGLTQPETVLNSPIEQSLETNRLVFVGDIMLARHVEYLMEENGYDYPFLGSQFLRREPAFLIGNFEATVPIKHSKTPNFTYQFSVNKKYLAGLTKSGFTHLSLANNHSLDYGYDGYNNSAKELTALGLRSFGQPKALGESTIAYLVASNTRYALIGLNATLMDITSELVRPYIEEASNNSDIQIVYIHWGEEYTHRPNQTQRKIAEFLAESGVDLIVGHHPHVIQSIEKIGDTLVFYSLGNYIFDQYFSDGVRQGLAISVAKKDEKLEISLWPHSSQESQAQPRLLDGKSRTNILTEIADYSDKNIAEMIINGEIIIPLSLASSTEIAIMSL